VTLFRIVYSSDFHASELVFRKFLSAGLMYQARALVVGGDLTGKALVPLIRVDGRYEAVIAGVRRTAETESELKQLRRLIANVGYYAQEMTPDEAQHYFDRPAEQLQLFRRGIEEQLTRWLELADQHLRPRGIPLYLIPGNDDPPFVDELLNQVGSSVVNVDRRRVELAGGEYLLVGLGVSNETPWHCPRDWPEERIEQELRRLLEHVHEPARSILLVHVPPYDSGLDTAPSLDQELRIRYAGGQVLTEPVGSRAVRRVIEEFQPLLGLHGHIHESPGFRKLGRTLCVNVGSEYAEGILRAAIINLERQKVKGYLPISG
jgi:Icc-related predicted phosphoesterase